MSCTTICAVAVAVPTCPLSSWTVNVTTYVPAVPYRCDVVTPVELPPSPKSQVYPTSTRPVAAVEADALKNTRSLVLGSVGEAVSAAVGGVPAPTTTARVTAAVRVRERQGDQIGAAPSVAVAGRRPSSGAPIAE